MFFLQVPAENELFRRYLIFEYLVPQDFVTTVVVFESMQLYKFLSLEVTAQDEMTPPKAYVEIT